MKVPARTTTFEKIKTDDFVTGTIKEVKYDLQHVFKGFGKDEKGNPNPDKIRAAVKLVFSIDGYKYDHSTNWLTFSLGERSNLLKKFVMPLVEGAEADMEFDLDQLIGFPCKMLWADKGEYQHIETIRPQGDKLKVDPAYEGKPNSEVEGDAQDDVAPF